MPCTEQMISRALERIANVRLNSFIESANNVRPNTPVTLTWATSNSDGVTVRLNGVIVPDSGSKTVTPIHDTRYSLVAEAGCGTRKNLGSLLLNVDESSCRMTTIEESLIRSLVINAIDAQITEHNASSSNDLSKRRETIVEVDTTGLIIKMRFKIAINNAPNPDLDVDMKIGMGVGPGNTVSVFYKSFSTDIDWPWWFDGITLGISLIIENIVENRIEAKLKPAVLNALRTRLADVARTIPGVLTRINPVNDAVQLTICR